MDLEDPDRTGLLKRTVTVSITFILSFETQQFSQGWSMNEAAR
jgi:hypothetical protein